MIISQIYILIVFIVAVLAVFSYFYWLPHQKSNFGSETKYVTVKKGDSVNTIAANLEQIGGISSKGDFVFFAKILGKSARLKEGRYAVKPRASMGRILGIIERGESTPYNVTIPEGYTMGQVSNLPTDSR